MSSDGIWIEGSYLWFLVKMSYNEKREKDMRNSIQYFCLASIICCLLIMMLSPFALAQVQNEGSVLFDDTEVLLQNGIKEMNRRKAAIAYNVANGTTPGFKPIRFQDEIENAVRLYGNASFLDEVNLDDEMVKATKVRLKHSAYVKLLTTKFGITKKVVTLGKGGQ